MTHCPTQHASSGQLTEHDAGYTRCATPPQLMTPPHDGGRVLGSHIEPDTGHPLHADDLDNDATHDAGPAEVSTRNQKDAPIGQHRRRDG